jgi:RNA polymerase sigma-32 factor
MYNQDIITKAIKDNPVLPASEQEVLIKAWQNDSNKAALDKVVLSNIKAVTKEVYKVLKSNSYLSHEDLMQEGLAGLLKAANMFDSSKEVNFLTYAMWWIKANMRRHVMGNRSIVKMGTTREDRILFSNLSKKIREGEEAGLGRSDSMKFAAKDLGVSLQSVEQMSVALKGFDTRLDTPVSSDNDSETLKVDLLEDKSAIDCDIYGLSDKKALSSMISSIVIGLPEDEKRVIEERFLSSDPKTLRDLSSEMGISREWVRKVEIKALDRIKKRLASQYNIREV